MIDTLCVLGVGLIGGSLARALREAGQVRRVVGCGRDRANLERALQLGVIDEAMTDPALAVQGADMIVVAVTLGATRDILARIAPALGSNALVTDVGSVKASVLHAARETLGDALPRFVAGHPIAGGEKSGVEASSATLYQRHRVILTPHPGQAPDALERVAAMWRAAGASVSCMDAARHDEILAATSHLPHLLAYALVASLLRLEGTESPFDYAAGGFRDFTRIASSNPAMWRDISLANAPALLAICDRFEEVLDEFRQAITRGDGTALEAGFAQAKVARDDFVNRSSKA